MRDNTPIDHFDFDEISETKDEAFERIKRELSSGITPLRKPRKLPLSELAIEYQVFQQRELAGRDLAGTVTYHVDNLLRNLRAETDCRLDPIIIWFTGRRWTILDGHHRYAAYLRYIGEEGETADNFYVPVKVFMGTFEDAFDLSLSANKKISEPLTASERSNAAWRRVCLDALEDNSWQISKKELAKRVTVSEAQVAKMRSAYLKISNANILFNSKPIDLTWTEALEFANGGRVVRDFTPDEQEIKAIDIAKRMGATFGKSLVSDPETFLLGLDRYSSQLHNQIIERILNDHGGFVEEWED
ncbi:hypothetical protein BFP76_00760 [Amylibacter kogurei]|uniref:ParB/Sulfiredoxin domain-containing protein n=1 Tax=Paramylibacter kogurei TaxID=1889778 RepID=A0A2G5K8E3_9RHOB|nr:hypothetical protein [Amylibacter kogurei]PIB25695.1 hypothetical protein BFP76_00760 [Amylibacter kogurei]